MKSNVLFPTTGRKSGLVPAVLLVLFTLMMVCADAQLTNVALRRPVSPSSPMYIMHIDTWNYADPQKIINLIPADIRPYVVMNISLSISHDSATSRFKVAEYGYEIAKSWLRVCAENRMWATVQPASGGMVQFSETDLSVYEEFYKSYPNFIGFNYAEQFWGFDDPIDPVSAGWANRMANLANQMKLANKYGGYLIVSWCGNQYSPNINPIGMLKRNPAFAAACLQYSKNYILCEKYTTVAYQHDMESVALGTYLSGLSGNYGIRYDDTGWTDSTGTHTSSSFTMGTSATPILEHGMLTGQTVIDGPELIWTQCFEETGAISTTDGYSTRNWQTFPQFNNVSVDLFRKVLDGSVRIPTRQEVIDRTKVAIINNVNAGSANDIYSSPETLFEGLYRMDNSGNYENNKTFFKKTGRYPTVPTMFQLSDAPANSFQVKVNRSDYATRWPTIAAKVAEFNSLFPQEYTGDIYAGRHENGWVVYNPYKTVTIANGRIPFKYNTSDSMELSLSQYSNGVIKETSNQLRVYLNNYDNKINTGLKTDLIKIYGAATQPTWSFTDRASHQSSVVSASWLGGVFVLTVQHNGPLDIIINCAGTASGRLSSYTPANIAVPDQPAAFAGPRQYEAEIFDYKNTGSLVSSGYNGNVRNYTGQGYISFGTNAAAALRKTVTVLQPGAYLLQTRYTATGNISTVDLYVNGVKVATPVFSQTANNSQWSIQAQTVTLNAGANTIEFKASAAATSSLVFDNIVLSSANLGKYHFENDIASAGPTDPPAYTTTLRSGTAGVIAYTDAASNTSNGLKAYTNGTVNGTGVMDLDLFAGTNNSSIVWKGYGGAPGGKRGVLLRGNGASTYATGLKQGYLFTTENNSNNSVTLRPYVAMATGITAQSTYTSSFTISANAPCWYRATASGNTLKLECSADSTNWEGGIATSFMDNTFAFGTTQLVWGLGGSDFSWWVDNITYYAPKLSVTKLALQGFEYAEGAGPSGSQSFVVSGQSLKADVPVVAPANYEVSLSAASGYAASLVLPRVADSLAATNVFVRLKAGLLTNIYKGDILIGDSENSIKVALSGGVRLLKMYTFTDDVPTTAPTVPPAANVTIGAGNDATAGVISYTDAGGNTSNFLKVYGVGTSANGTAVLDLNLFPADAADYSVTWKQAVPDSTKQYKNGVLLRGSGVGGYTLGIKQGYLFNASNGSPSSIAFRIFKSTASGIGSAMVSTTVNSNLRIANNKPVWYRASVSGASSVSLKFEYSVDSLVWYTATSYSDVTAPFTSGATQYVSGLFSSGNEYYLDNIVFGSTPASADIIVSQTALTGYTYSEGAGPSANQLFTVSASKLGDDITLTAPATFEISLSANTGFGNTLTLPQTSGTIVATTIYARLKAGLAAGLYDGNMTFAYATQPSGFDKVVVFRGAVSKPAISVSPSAITDLGYVASVGLSVERSFIVSGSTLSQNLTITAPAGFDISLGSGSGYTTSLSLAPINGNVAPTVIYTRLATGMPVGNYNANINLSSTGAESKTLPLAGSIAAQAGVYVSATTLVGFSYSSYSNVPPVRSFLVWGKPLAGDITVLAPSNFEVSRTAAGGYASSLILGMSNGAVDTTIVYIRLKESLAENTYSGDVVVSSTAAVTKLVGVSGTVSASRVYDFTGDIPTTSATTPPASGIVVAAGNSATGGVVSYTDASPATSNRFRAYSGGQRNATGAMDLGLFPNNAADYSVTWKESVGSNTDYKVGVLLRGNAPLGTATIGYVQGLMQGYLFIVYTAKGQATPHSEFRIYPSTASTSLSAYVNNSVNTLVPANGQNVWYRASVSGSATVNLKLEYSTDSVTWITAATATDPSASRMLSGATQLVWGLGSANYNFFLDDITFALGNNPLPVSLLSFTAKAEKEAAQLNWRTANETDNKGFGIEHSTDGVYFTTVGTVAGGGNAAAAKDYSFTHLTPAAGINYYRLKQMDLDGRSKYSEVKKVDFGTRPSMFVLKTNPVHEEAILNFVSSNNRILILQVLDATGKTVTQRQWSIAAGQNTMWLNTAALAKGVYYVQVKDAQGMYSTRMLKE